MYGSTDYVPEDLVEYIHRVSGYPKGVVREILRLERIFYAGWLAEEE